MTTQADSVVAVVDVETNGLDSPVDIVEIAVVLLHPVSLATVEEFHTLVQPTARNSTGRMDIHGVTAEMVKDAPSFHQIAPQIAELLDGRVLAAHNLPFEVDRLTEEFARHGGSFRSGRGICTYQLTGRTLNEAAAALDVPHTKAHAALEDARATAGILRTCYQEVVRQTIAVCSISANRNVATGSIKQRPSASLRNQEPATPRQLAIMENILKEEGGTTKNIAAFHTATALEIAQLIKGFSSKGTLTAPPATERQKSYLADLLYENGIYNANLNSLSKIEASNLIDELLENPARVKAEVFLKHKKQSVGYFSLRSWAKTLQHRKQSDGYFTLQSWAKTMRFFDNGNSKN